ncbi:MAG TPA: hypothetical protein VNL14_03850 [Candidatus Acidoferrales bacterium]|nr:hypothetical protein [Candidatus Acidoferrales bacterium]
MITVIFTWALLPVCVSALAGLPAGGAKAITDYAGLVEHLRGAGFAPRFEEIVEQPFFSVKGKVLAIGDEHLQVFEYPTPEAASAEAARISPDGMTVGTTKVHWLGPPHFYRSGKLLVLYLGTDKGLRRALESALGLQFAGQ